MRSNGKKNLLSSVLARKAASRALSSSLGTIRLITMIIVIVSDHTSEMRPRELAQNDLVFS